VRLGFSLRHVRSKHREWACGQAHPCALARRANPEGVLVGEATKGGYSEETGLLVETVTHRGAHG
jgi:hypothetical protein